MGGLIHAGLMCSLSGERALQSHRVKNVICRARGGIPRKRYLWPGPRHKHSRWLARRGWRRAPESWMKFRPLSQELQLPLTEVNINLRYSEIELIAERLICNRAVFSDATLSGGFCRDR